MTELTLIGPWPADVVLDGASVSIIPLDDGKTALWQTTHGRVALDGDRWRVDHDTLIGGFEAQLVVALVPGSDGRVGELIAGSITLVDEARAIRDRVTRLNLGDAIALHPHALSAKTTDYGGVEFRWPKTADAGARADSAVEWRPDLRTGVRTGVQAWVGAQEWWTADMLHANGWFLEVTESIAYEARFQPLSDEPLRWTVDVAEDVATLRVLDAKAGVLTVPVRHFEWTQARAGLALRSAPGGQSVDRTVAFTASGAGLNAFTLSDPHPLALVGPDDLGPDGATPWAPVSDGWLQLAKRAAPPKSAVVEDQVAVLVDDGGALGGGVDVELLAEGSGAFHVVLVAKTARVTVDDPSWRVISDAKTTPIVWRHAPVDGPLEPPPHDPDGRRRTSGVWLSDREFSTRVDTWWHLTIEPDGVWSIALTADQARLWAGLDSVLVATPDAWVADDAGANGAMSPLRGLLPFALDSDEAHRLQPRRRRGRQRPDAGALAGLGGSARHPAQARHDRRE